MSVPKLWYNYGVDWYSYITNTKLQDVPMFPKTIQNYNTTPYRTIELQYNYNIELYIYRTIYIEL